MADLYFGNDLGEILGPYTADEIEPQQRAKQHLGLGKGREVYAVRAQSTAHARAILRDRLHGKSTGA